MSGSLGEPAQSVAVWIRGWALSRGVPPPVEAYGGWRVEVGLPDQKRRFVFAEANPGVREAAQVNGEPNVFVKVCATAKAVEPHLPSGWRIAGESVMMSASELLADARPPSGYSLGVDLEGAMWRVKAADRAGRLAASGGMTLPSPGEAVFDRIVTEPGYQRLGLGRAVMAELGRIARAEGASHGLLIATPDGRALYETLGWQVYSPYTTAVWSDG